jgi:hypothetical protein
LPDKPDKSPDSTDASSKSLDTVDTSDKSPDTVDDALPDRTKGRVMGLPDIAKHAHLDPLDVKPIGYQPTVIMDTKTPIQISAGKQPSSSNNRAIN